MLTLEVKAEAIQVLMDLGFTATQARAYLALCQLGSSNVKAIAKESRIARQDIYRVLAELQEMGFVEKALTDPVAFEAISLEETIDVMMKARAKKSCELETKTRTLLQKFTENDKKRIIGEGEEPQFVLIPRGRACLKKGKEAIEAARGSIDCVTSYKRFLQMMFVTSKEIVEALNRGVKFRFVLEKPDTERTLPKDLEDFCKTSACNIRYISSPPQAIIAIYDEKTVHYLIQTDSDKGDFMKLSMLSSKNPSFISIMKDYFETMWFKQSKRSLEVQEETSGIFGPFLL